MSIRWEGDDLGKRMDEMDDRIRRALVVGAHYVAPQAEQWMKNNAKWSDQTGNARNGLKAVVQTAGQNQAAIVLHHSVFYGVFLEVRWGGKFAIIDPTVKMFAPIYAKTVGQLAFSRGSV